MSFTPKCLATAIGSLPHAKAEDAVRVVLANIPDAPIWPQLPANGMNEQMEIQYSEGLPRVVIDREKERMFIDTTGDYSLDLATFYENYLMENLDYFQITPAFSKGIYAMEAALQAAGGTRPFVKVQTTGPISFGLTIVDENKRAIYYNAEFVDVVVKGLAMKCRWQIKKFRPFAAGRHLLHRRADPLRLRLLHLRQRVSARMWWPSSTKWWRPCMRRARWPACTAAATPSGRS